MKLLLSLLFVFLNLHSALTQVQNRHRSQDEIIKAAKVKTSSTFYFKHELDSTLTTLTTYDSLGGQLSSKMFSNDGVVIGFNTLIYDANHHVAKQIHTDGTKTMNETTIAKKVDGRLISIIGFADSTYSRHVSTNDEFGRFKQAISYCSNGDSTVLNIFYNHEGWLAKYIVLSKEGKTVTTNSYNSLGSVTRKTTTDPFSRSLTEYRYRRNGDCYEAATYNYTTRKWDKIYRTHYSNGLIYEVGAHWNNVKATTFNRTYYTYH